MLAALIVIVIIAIVFTLALCKAAGDADRKAEEEEFKGYVNCDKDCYMCDSLEDCKREVEREGKV